MTVVDRLAAVLDRRMSRRSFAMRSAFAGSALAAGKGAFVLRPHTPYAALCDSVYCGSPDCSCGSTCCAGYTEFCCVLDGGYNSCPSGTVMGGWWKADGSIYCDGPRYYMDCNAVCQCADGCGDGFSFCDPGCDGLSCGCAGASCDNYLTGCFQFRYGQCNQDVTCIGRIQCRVVTCIPPWEIEPSCTHTVMEDDYTADQTAACLGPEPTYPVPPCPSPETACEVVAIAVAANDGRGYGVVTAFGREFHYGDEQSGSVTRTLTEPIVAMVARPGGGYWLAGRSGRVFPFGAAKWHGDQGDDPLPEPMVDMAATPTGSGYWLVTAAGNVVPFGDAADDGTIVNIHLASPIVAMASAAAIPPSDIVPSPKAGYWLLTEHGRVYQRGAAVHYGDLAAAHVTTPMVALVATPSATGYWMVNSAGVVTAFGGAKLHGDLVSVDLPYPIVGMAATHTGAGYYLVGRSGVVYPFGDAVYRGAPAPPSES